MLLSNSFNDYDIGSWFHHADVFGNSNCCVMVVTCYYTRPDPTPATTIGHFVDNKTFMIALMCKMTVK